MRTTAEVDETVILTVLRGHRLHGGSRELRQRDDSKRNGRPAVPVRRRRRGFSSRRRSARIRIRMRMPIRFPENVEEVMAMGFEAWIDDQFARPVGTLRPMVQWQNEQPGSAQIYNDRKQNAWWGRAMGLPKLRPDAVDHPASRSAAPARGLRAQPDLRDLGPHGTPRRRAGRHGAFLRHCCSQHSFGNFANLLARCLAASRAWASI